jgi:hypothetical protein
MKKSGIIITSILVLLALFVSCESTDEEGTPDERAIARGVEVWNEREPASAESYWNEISNAKTKKQYLNYIALYNAGVEALNSTDSIKSTNETKLLAACNKALDSFTALNASLKLPPDVADKGATLSAGRISALLASNKISAARKMYSSSKKVYGTDNEALAAIGKEIDTVDDIIAKKTALDDEGQKALAIDSFDDKIAAIDATLADYTSAENNLAANASNNGLSKKPSVVNSLKDIKKAHQDLSVERESIIRERAYEYKDRIGAEFARTPEGGKDGKMKLEDILAHYESVKQNIEKIYSELLTFAARFPNDIGQDILDDINAQRKDLEAKITQVNKEIATAKEIASRGKVVMPLLIGLFNPDPSSTKDSKKSRPAKFSATKVKDDEYWWGMVSIPKGQMNDLVITLKDNRTVRVFSENTKSGKLIEKNKMKDLVNRTYKVGNSWPVLNAGGQLKTDKYFFEIQKGKTDSYEGEVVVYSSFVVRMR